MIHLWVEEVLADFFGEGNHIIQRTVVDHANSNAFFKQVSVHYKLDRFGHLFPSPEVHPDYFIKAVADLFEGWIGFCILSRRLFDKDASLIDLQEFFAELFSLRYYNLRPYTCSVLSRSKGPDDLQYSTAKPKINEVKTGEILECLSSLDIPSDKSLGFLVRAKVMPPSTNDKAKTLTAFATCREDAKRIQSGAFWHDPRHLRNLLQLTFSAPISF